MQRAIGLTWCADAAVDAEVIHRDMLFRERERIHHPAVTSYLYLAHPHTDRDSGGTRGEELWIGNGMRQLSLPYLGGHRPPTIL